LDSMSEKIMNTKMGVDLLAHCNRCTKTKYYTEYSGAGLSA